MDTLKVVKLSKNAHIPTRGTPLSAGLDLYSAHGGTIPPRGKLLVKTDLMVSTLIFSFSKFNLSGSSS